MIRTLLKLAVVALVANATWHAFGAFSPHYKFRDSLQYAAQFRGELSDEGLRDKALTLASQFDIPLESENLVVTHDGPHTIIRLSYLRRIELAPGFSYPWEFSTHIDVLTNHLPSESPPK